MAMNLYERLLLDELTSVFQTLKSHYPVCGVLLNDLTLTCVLGAERP